jgi:hypothetical protein
MIMVEAGGMCLRRTSRTLPAEGGPRPSFEVVQPFSVLSGLQKSLAATGLFVALKGFCQEHVEFADYLSAFGVSTAVFAKTSFQVVCDADVSLPIAA